VGLPSRAELHGGAAPPTAWPSPGITALAWKAQRRLCARYRRRLARGKPNPHAATAVACELLGFIWAIGVEAERAAARASAA
jgi:hypothetical protein